MVADLYPSSKMAKENDKADIKGFETRMENIALAMTNSIMIRSQHNSTSINSTLIEGIALKTEPYHKVELYWLMMPTVIWLLFSILLCSTLVQSCGGMYPIWKFSPLVLLDCETGIAESLDVVMETHNETYAQARPLEHTLGAWRLEREMGSCP
ncbi:hypothetical protein EJ08DRAFT_122266 [Tothia fuscella]|uniref:Uncharacterized protein n=1 Tax=Tothia fuscella TaxID=1048955 RepID=A0A9P4U148_9PEZI|nr:hypothetical protein EJ08DRAFT_122266 [Tothia fuscella]